MRRSTIHLWRSLGGTPYQLRMRAISLVPLLLLACPRLAVAQNVEPIDAPVAAVPGEQATPTPNPSTDAASPSSIALTPTQGAADTPSSAPAAPSAPLHDAPARVSEDAATAPAAVPVSAPTTPPTTPAEPAATTEGDNPVTHFFASLVAPGSTFDFLERNYIAYRLGPGVLVPRSRGGTPQLFEAELAPHFFFYNSLSRMTANDFKDGDYPNLSVAISFTMGVRLRMLREESAPVRTPSFMPRLNVQTYWLSKRPTHVGAPFALNEARLSLGHHSNGQEGCPFEPGKLEGEGCEPNANRPNPLDVNRMNGSFSINHLTLALHHLWGSVHEAALTTRRAELHDQESTSVGVVAMWYPLGFLKAGANTDEQASLYGTANIRVEASHERMVPPLFFLPGSSPGQTRFEAAYTQYLGTSGPFRQLQLWDAGRADAVAAYLLTATATYSSIKSGGIGFYLRLDHGRDYYNMLFVDTITQVLLGFVIDTSGKLNFGEAPKPASHD